MTTQMNEAQKLHVVADHAGIPVYSIAKALGVSEAQFWNWRKENSPISLAVGLHLRKLREIVTVLLSDNTLPLKAGKKREIERRASQIFLTTVERINGPLAD